jgi:hydroxymethylpyrimidine kinase/phosphomethylpyrimidine kinase/thiamine-phosphate diphosphorylase
LYLQVSLTHSHIFHSQSDDTETSFLPHSSMKSFCLLFLSAVISQAMTSPIASTSSSASTAPPIVYTIAGSDSGGGAGIQADLHTMHAFGCHGCSAITCLTAQNSCGVTEVHAPPAAFLTQQLETLHTDMPPRAIKIGMLGTQELAETVGAFLKKVTTTSTDLEKPWVVVDPVMISTSGHKLIDDAATKAMIASVFPYADVLTPNKYEAEALLGRTLDTPADVEAGAREIIDTMNVKAVLIKGGHSLMEKQQQDDTKSTTATPNADVNATLGYAQDYFLSKEPDQDEPRLCDGGVWIRTDRYDSEHTHGTGCTLSSAIASALALGHRERSFSDKSGATSSILPIDACCLGKAYVTAGIGRGVGLGQGPGPVVHTTFPSTFQHYPRIALNPTSADIPAFIAMKAYGAAHTDDSTPTLGRILPIVDTVDWVERLTETTGITDIQLRIKDDSLDAKQILERVQHCQDLCAKHNVRLWINDFWEAAVEAGCFGVHVGQEDLYKCKEAGGLEALHKANMALGISTHSYGELAAALAVKPTYISLGPIFGTTSKKVAFDPQGLATLSKWRQLLPPGMPFVTIGGIGDAATAKLVKEAGTDCAAVIGAITKADNVEVAVAELNQAMS